MTAAPGTPRRARLHRRVRLIVAATIAWNVVEAVIAVTAGAAASSAALIGFGLDSVVEVLSAAAVAWQFSRRDPERWESATVRTIGVAFFLLAAYVTIDAILALTGAREPDRSPVGVGLAIASLLVMPALAGIEHRTGRELGSRSVLADARQLVLCIYLSAAVLVGLLLNLAVGWEWADSAAALVVAGLAVREGVEAWRGDIESPREMLEQLRAETEDSAERR